MTSWTAEEVADGLERWLKTRRDEAETHGVAWHIIDVLLDEVRDAGVEGWFPWQRISTECDTPLPVEAPGWPHDHMLEAAMGLLASAVAHDPATGWDEAKKRWMDAYHAKLADDEPRFVIRAQDKHAVLTVEAHEDLCIEDGNHEQAAEDRKAKTEIQVWQENHPDRVKTPDHKHRPAR